jgi:hypothetical protein
MARASLVLAAILPGCSYAAYTPPTRTMPLETPAAPAAGGTDVQLEASSVGAVMGFSVRGGAARLRHGVHRNVALTAEGGMMQVGGGNDKSTDASALVGRVGVHVHPANRPRVAATAGVGSGASGLAGRWASVDAGVIASTETYHWVPFLALEGFFSSPIDPEPFTYNDTAGDPRRDVLSDSVGVRGTAGVEWRPGAAGPESRTSLLAGLTYGAIADAGDDDTFLGFGAAVKVKLD